MRIENMGIGYIDIGVNLLDESFKKDLDDVIDRSFESNVNILINTSSSIEEAKRSLDLTKKYPSKYTQRQAFILIMLPWLITNLNQIF